MIEATLAFDGGGGECSGVACYGSFRWDFAGRTDIGARVPLPDASTSNEAEYLILIRALESLLATLAAKQINPARVRLVVKGDSQLVVKQINGQWKCREDRMYALCARACVLLNNFHADTRVEWHARRHSVAAFGH